VAGGAEGHSGHGHAGNRFGVPAAAARLGADATLSGRGVTIAFLDSGFHPHPDLTEPEDRILAFHDAASPGALLDGDRSPQASDWHGTQTSGATFPAGFSAPLHMHSSDMHVVIVSGTFIHGPEGKPEVRLPAGSYLKQPDGNYRHTTACDKASECVFFAEGKGKFDLKMVEEKAPAKK
jgi:hypothetical protein